MEVKEIKHKDIWESFLLNCEEKTFLQSWNWGEFNKTMGDRVWRFGVYDNDKLLSVALVIKIKAKRGNFLLLPHGPLSPRLSLAPHGGNVVSPSGLRSAPLSEASLRSPPSLKEKILKALLEKLKKVAKEEKASFVRIAPIWERTEENAQIFKKLGFREAPIHVHPELTWVLDITSSEEELLAQMRKTTRYLVRQGMKNKELRIYQSQDIKDLEALNLLYQETAKRHNFVPFSWEYLNNELLRFSPDNQALVFTAKYKDEVLASAIIIFWQGRAFYHQGASSPKYPKIPASYLLQWETIREAKKRGCISYNFWGIADIESRIKNQESRIKKHPWRGLTLFKTGFGGYRKEYVKTQDLPTSKSYWLTYLFETLRKKKRGF